MMMTKHKAVQIEPIVRDHRDLPQQLDVFGLRLRAARIPFRVHATQTGFSVVIRPLKGPVEFARRLTRAWDIWQGTRRCPHDRTTVA